MGARSALEWVTFLADRAPEHCTLARLKRVYALTMTTQTRAQFTPILLTIMSSHPERLRQTAWLEFTLLAGQFCANQSELNALGGLLRMHITDEALPSLQAIATDASLEHHRLQPIAQAILDERAQQRARLLLQQAGSLSLSQHEGGELTQQDKQD